MKWLNDLTFFRDDLEITKETRNNQVTWTCYLSTYWHWEDFDYVWKGEGKTLQEAVENAFAARMKK